jgi:hypothetical protein
MYKAKFKNVMISRNLIKKLSKEAIAEIESELYFEEKVKCVDAVHIDEQGNQSREYTWFIPTNLYLSIEIGDTLVVEQLIGTGLAVVKAVSTVYEKTKSQHEEDVHPYCPVISNLGVRL